MIRESQAQEGENKQTNRTKHENRVHLNADDNIGDCLGAPYEQHQDLRATAEAISRSTNCVLSSLELVGGCDDGLRRQSKDSDQLYQGQWKEVKRTNIVRLFEQKVHLLQRRRILVLEARQETFLQADSYALEAKRHAYDTESKSHTCTARN